MAKRKSWLSLDSNLPHDPKLSGLQDNDARWVWICLLCLEKRGELEGQDVAGFYHYCHVEQSKFISILNSMKSAGLLDESFRPVGFIEWQRRQQSRERTARHRKNVTQCNAGVTQPSRNVAKMTPSDTETDTDQSKIKSDESDSPRQKNKETKKKAETVLAHLSKTIGKTLTMTKDIEACFRREKCTVDECILVIDYKWHEWAGTENQKHVNHTTLFRARNFAGYLDMAMAFYAQKKKRPVPKDLLDLVTHGGNNE